MGVPMQLVDLVGLQEVVVSNRRPTDVNHTVIAFLFAADVTELHL
jgi:hypothetical protein